MKHMTDTVVKYILSETSRHSGILRFVLPSYPAALLSKIGFELEERFSRMVERHVDWKYEIACRLGREWKNGPSDDQAIYQRIYKKGWYNEDDNLTRLRNTVKDPDSDCLVILLAGYEHIDDRASLRDFFHLNQETVWELCLGRSFYPWVEDCLKDYVNLDGSEKEIQRMADVFQSLYNNALTDLLGVSSYLGNLDLTGVMTCNDAYQLILSNLSPFKLPSINGLNNRYRSKKSFAAYIRPAQNFFNYNMFLSLSNRKKTLEKIAKFRERHGAVQLEQDTLGSFVSLGSLLDALCDYIENGSDAAREKLLTADFVYVHDKILKFRPGKDKDKKPRKSRGAKVLSGLPLEVFLRALWITLGDFKRETREALLVDEKPLAVTINGIAFRHSFDDVDGGEKAKGLLQRLLGGIDSFLKDQLTDFGDPKAFRVKVDSKLLPDESGTYSYQRNMSAKPRLKFNVGVSLGGDQSYQREFYWALPVDHQSLLLDALYQLARDQYKAQDSRNFLPVFTIPYMSEIFMAADEEAVNRLLGTALRTKCSLTDLTGAVGFDDGDPVKPLLNELSIAFQRYLGEYARAGFFGALESQYASLYEMYCVAYERYLADDESNAGPLLLKAFMLIGGDRVKHEGWLWDHFQKSMVVTPLHPALLEMIYEYHRFLCKGFCFYARRGLQKVGGQFSEKTWDQIVDLSRVKWPVYGTLKDETGVVDTNVRSYGYFHLVGGCAQDPASINAHLLLEYEDEDEDEITDTDLFRETRASALIRRILSDYHALHGYADDGLSIAAYCGGEVQPLVSGIDGYLSTILKDRDDRVYTIRLNIFSDSGDDSSVMRWVNAWKERWQGSETGSKRHYGNCKISIAYRVVSKDGSYGQFHRLLQGLEVDVMFFMDFIKSGASHFLPLSHDVQDSDYKFPILEKVSCRQIGGGRDYKRDRILSNQRFKASTLHAQVMASITPIAVQGKEYVVVSISDFQKWVSVIDVAHQHSAWVACIDQSIDEQLLRIVEPNGTRKREVIGFGTGVGSQGENNYTVSTEQFSLVDISNRIAVQIARLFEFPDGSLINGIAESLVREASSIGGLSIVKATGSSEYVRDYIAYALVRKLLPADGDAFCDEIISLDAFQHWFDGTSDQRRPDILRLRANIKDGYFNIQVQVMECKLAQESEGHLEKARQQIENGLRRLIPCFLPRRDGGESEERMRPDQRYWWMQLHRLIASKGKANRAEYNLALQALERLSEGYFNITWQGAAVVFWTDVEVDRLSCTRHWNFNVDGEEIVAPVAIAGKPFISRVCLEDAKGDIFSGATAASYSHKGAGGASDITTEDTPSQPGDKGEKGEPKQEGALGGGQTTDIEDDHASGRPGECSGGNTTPVCTVPRIPERILLGGGTAGGRNVYWEFGHPRLFNRHLLIFGASGTGKTYTVQALLCEFGKSGQNSLIVDYTNGFTTQQLESTVVEKLNPKQHVVRVEPLPINPFRKQSDFIDDLKLEEDSATTARRVRDLFAQVYQLGDQQQSALYNAIRDGVEQDGNHFNLERLLGRLDAIYQEGGPSANSAASLISKLQPFVDMRPFGKEDVGSWERLFTDTGTRCHIIQLAGFMKDTAQLITEFSLFDLYWYYRARGKENSPKVIVLDEIQNLNHGLNSPLGQLLTEGRKFGISLILATQTLSNLTKSERDRLFQASHKLFFKPADTEVRSFAKILADATNEHVGDWVDRLSSLRRGECYSLGDVLNEATGQLEARKWFKIRICSLEQRILE